MISTTQLSFALPYRKPLLFGIALRMLDGLLGFVPLLLLYSVLCALIMGTPLWNAATMLACLLGLVALRAILLWCSLRATVPAGFSMLSLLRGQYADRIRHMPMGWFQTNSTGDISGALLQDLASLEPLLVEQLASGAAVLCQILVGIACVFVIDWRLGLLLCCGIIPALLFMLWVNKRLARSLPQKAQALSDATSRIIEFTEGITVLKAFGITSHSMQRYAQAMNRNRDVNLEMIRSVGAAAFFYFICLELGYAALVAFGLPMPDQALSQASANPAHFLVFILTALLALRIYALANTLVDLAGFVRQGLTALDRLNTLYPEAAPLASSPTICPAQSAQPQGHEIAFDRVGFSYAPDIPALSDISFRMQEGTITALVGASGSGKTTIANLLCRFWDVQSGSIHLGGTELRNMSEETLWRQLTIVFQNVHLFSDTVSANIKLGKPDATDEEVRQAAEAAQCHNFIMQLPQGYDTVLEEGGAALSGGQRQRLSIARAILKNAPIIILDEATASVDLENEVQIQKALSALIQHKTVLMIAHRLSTVTSADQILVLHDGRIAEQGTHTELLHRNGRYAQLWTAQHSPSDPEPTPAHTEAE